MKEFIEFNEKWRELSKYALNVDECKNELQSKIDELNLVIAPKKQELDTLTTQLSSLDVDLQTSWKKLGNLIKSREGVERNSLTILSNYFENYGNKIGDEEFKVVSLLVNSISKNDILFADILDEFEKFRVLYERKKALENQIKLLSADIEADIEKKMKKRKNLIGIIHFVLSALRMIGMVLHIGIDIQRFLICH